MTKECPLCTTFMRLVKRENISRVPGSSQEVKSVSKEWVCPECDYFEEEEGSGGGGDTDPNAPQA